MICVLLSFQVQSGTNWIKKDLCTENKEEIDECKNVGKNLYRYNKFMKKDLSIGPIVGVVYIKEGQNRGTNQKIITKVSGYYYLINDMGDIKNLITTFASDPELSVK